SRTRSRAHEAVATAAIATAAMVRSGSIIMRQIGARRVPRARGGDAPDRIGRADAHAARARNPARAGPGRCASSTSATGASARRALLTQLAVLIGQNQDSELELRNTVTAPGHIGQYRILRKIGAGGMGMV